MDEQEIKQESQANDQLIDSVELTTMQEEKQTKKIEKKNNIIVGNDFVQQDIYIETQKLTEESDKVQSHTENISLEQNNFNEQILNNFVGKSIEEQFDEQQNELTMIEQQFLFFKLTIDFANSINYQICQQFNQTEQTLCNFSKELQIILNESIIVKVDEETKFTSKKNTYELQRIKEDFLINQNQSVVDQNEIEIQADNKISKLQAKYLEIQQLAKANKISNQQSNSQEVEFFTFQEKVECIMLKLEGQYQKINNYSYLRYILQVTGQNIEQFLVKYLFFFALLKILLLLHPQTGRNKFLVSSRMYNVSMTLIGNYQNLIK